MARTVSRAQRGQLATALTPADPKPQIIRPRTNTTDSDPRFLQLVPYVTGALTAGTRVGTWVYDVIATVNGATTGYQHPLGRTPNGFLILNANADIDFWITNADLASFTSTTAAWHASAAGLVRGFWL